MANPYKLIRADLVGFLQNLEDRLAAHDIVPIPNAEQTARAAMINTARVALAAAVADLIIQESEYHAAVSVAEAAQLFALDETQSVKFLMKADGCNGATFALAGFNPPVITPIAYVPNDPTDLSAFGYSNNVNSLKWKGNNSFGAINYVVECLIGASIIWEPVGTTTRQRFNHTGVVPGTRYEYRVFARAASADSGPTGSAVVY
jgi:hypothetical protein